MRGVRRMPQRTVLVQHIVVAPTALLPLQVSGVLEIVEDRERRTRGDPDLRGDIAHSGVMVSRVKPFVSVRPPNRPGAGSVGVGGRDQRGAGCSREFLLCVIG